MVLVPLKRLLLNAQFSKVGTHGFPLDFLGFAAFSGFDIVLNFLHLLGKFRQSLPQLQSVFIVVFFALDELSLSLLFRLFGDRVVWGRSMSWLTGVTVRVWIVTKNW